MKKSKVEILKSLIGKEFKYSYTKNNMNRRDLVNYLSSCIAEHNKRNNDNITYSIKDNCFISSDDQVINLPITEKIGILQKVRSKDIILNDIHINMADISLDIKNNIVNGFITSNNGIYKVNN